MMTEKEKAILAIKANAYNEIVEIVANPWEYCFGGTEEENNFRIGALGAVYGITAFVNDAVKALEERENEA